MPVEATVDRSRLIRAGYVLCAVMALFAAYKIFSPKDPFQTIARVALPWADPKTMRSSPAGMARNGTRCSLPLRAPMVCMMIMGGGSSSIGEGTRPLLRRKREITSALVVGTELMEYHSATIVARHPRRMTLPRYNLK